LPRSGLDAALHTAAGLNEVDRREQEWIISALLATRSRTSAHPSGPVTGRTPTSSVVHPDRLIAAACAVADRIVAKAANGEDGDERVNWLGLEAVDDRQWLVLPLGASLGNGYLGVAVFLAQLTAVTGIDRYAEHAHRAVTDAAAVVDTFAERPERVLDAGWGGLAGLGGLTYGFARLSALLDDRNLAEAADRLVVLADGSVDNLSTLDWTGGLAGCLTAMSSVHLDLGLGSAAQVAGRCADRLARLAADVEGGSTSFADGLAGIGWALTRHGPHEVHRAAGRRLAALAVRDASAGGGWCHGSPGLALARSCLPAAAGPDATVLADVPLRDSLCLCHGELGVADVLRTLADADEHRDAAGPALRRRAGRILEVLRRNGPVCGVPGSVATPGLLNGLAGIGYGLLRLAVPEQVPSVLLLEPAATAPASTRPELDGGEL
jgi:lantibiotic modifying enzyme